jgi:nicotinamidase-related amidase
MTTLENRPNTALLVVDVQNGVVGGAHGRDAVVANVGNLVEQARREQVPVVWVQHSDDELVRGQRRLADHQERRLRRRVLTACAAGPSGGDGGPLRSRRSTGPSRRSAP